MKPSSWRTIGGRLRIVLLGLVAASVLLPGGLLILTSSRASSEQLRLTQQASARLTAEKVNSYVDDLKRKLAYLSHVRGLASFDPAVQHDLLEALSVQNKAYETIGIVDAQGLLRQAVSLTSEATPTDWATTQAFRRTFQEQEDWVGAVEQRPEPASPSMILAVPIRDRDNTVDGMLFASVSLKFLLTVLEEANATDGAYSYIIDQRELVIAHSPQVPPSYAFADLARRPLGVALAPVSVAGGGPYVGLLGVEVLGEIARVSTTGWRIVIELPASQAYAPVVAMTALMGAGLTLALLAALLVSMRLAGQFTRPLRQLTTAAERLQSGDLSARVTVDQDNEFRVLAGAFNQMATHLADTIAKLQASNKDLSTFSYSISHDLRAPLRSINGFAALLERLLGEGLDAKGRHYLDVIESEAERMGILIEELLDYSRLGRESVRSEPVPLPPILAALRSTFGERITAAGATLLAAEPLAVPQADPLLLERILANLLDNALTYARPGVPPVITLAATRAEGEVTISLADNGIGIPEQYREKIFEVFARLHVQGEYPGTGIGLSIARRVACLMGSDVAVASLEGEGSTFSLVLPAAAGEPAEAPE